MYSLSFIHSIASNKHTYVISEDVKNNIIKMALEIGKPILSFENTQKIFLKNSGGTSGSVKSASFSSSSSSSSSSNNNNNNQFNKKRNNKNKNVEIKDDSEWERVAPLKNTNIVVQREGIDGSINQIRINLNKITDKNYLSISEKITEIIDDLVLKEITDEDFNKVGTNIFEIASNNRFYSKIYADLYSNLIKKYEVMKKIFQTNCNEYFKLFENVEYVDSTEDYDKFCENNKINESRKSISAFFLNLVKNKVMTRTKLFIIIVKLFEDIINYISIEGKVNEVNELVENVVILYEPTIFSKFKDELIFNDKTETIIQVIKKLAQSKNKEYPSLSMKTKFKFMSFVEDNKL